MLWTAASDGTGHCSIFYICPIEQTSVSTDLLPPLDLPAHSSKLLPAPTGVRNRLPELLFTLSVRVTNRVCSNKQLNQVRNKYWK
jgi:hypothetical protein